MFKALDEMRKRLQDEILVQQQIRVLEKVVRDFKRQQVMLKIYNLTMVNDDDGDLTMKIYKLWREYNAL